MEHYYDIFISFDTSEEITAREFYDKLVAIGYSVFNFQKTKVPGSSNNFRVQEKAALDNTKFFLLLCNGNSYASEEVTFECNSFAEEHQSDHVFIFEVHGFKENHIRIDSWKKCVRCNDVTEQINLIKEKIPLCYSDQKVKIKSIETDKLYVSIDNKIIEVSDNYEDLKTLMTKHDTSCFEWKNNEYNIHSLNSDSFDYLIGKIECNQLLAKQLIEAISKNSKEVNEKFYHKAILTPKWEYHPKIIDKAKEIISYSFISVIGKQLSKLMAIGKEDFSEDKLKKYKEKCYQIMKYTIELLSFTLLSKLWDDVNAKTIQLSEQEKKIISDRMNIAFEPLITNKINFLNGLIKIYIDNEDKIEFPVAEIKNNYLELLPQGNVYQSCIILKELTEKKANILNCYKAETHLATVLAHFSFLAKYHMISMKKIDYRQIRNKLPDYLHQYIALGIDNKAHVDAEKSELQKSAVFTDAVLLYKGDDYNNHCINLFPLVIDYNALSIEHGAKICFFSYKQNPFDEDSLEYICLEDNSKIALEKNNILARKKDINDIFLSKEEMKIYNIDCIIDVFNEMQECLTSEEKLFNNL